eukprot:3355087-Prorocentrum_lima.AAC.1
MYAILLDASYLGANFEKRCGAHDDIRWLVSKTATPSSKAVPSVQKQDKCNAGATTSSQRTL